MAASCRHVTSGIRAGRATLTVSAGLVRGLVGFAARQGVEGAALLARAELSPRTIADDDARIPFGLYAALYRAAEELCEDPAFALHLGEWIDGMDLVVCHIGSASPTMGGALEAINQYNRLAIDVETAGGGDPYKVERADEGVWLIDTCVYPGEAPQVTETSFVRLIAGSRQISSRQFVRRVCFVRSAPLHREEYRRVFGAPVSFGQEANAMLLDPEWLTLPLPPTAPYADSVLAKHAGRLMEDLNDLGSRRRRVADVVGGRLSSGRVNMTAVARELGMSRSALYRLLRDEGTTFEQIVDQACLARATRMLENGRTIDEIAASLGYSDRSAFSRAFKRWTGASPRSVGRR